MELLTSRSQLFGSYAVGQGPPKEELEGETSRVMEDYLLAFIKVSRLILWSVYCFLSDANFSIRTLITVRHPWVGCLSTHPPRIRVLCYDSVQMGRPYRTSPQAMLKPSALVPGLTTPSRDGLNGALITNNEQATFI